MESRHPRTAPDPTDDPLVKESVKVEERIVAAIATTAPDLIVQVKLLANCGNDFTWDDTFDQLCENIQEGIFRLAANTANPRRRFVRGQEPRSAQSGRGFLVNAQRETSSAVPCNTVP
jgi:hypothetical protein